MKMRFMNRWNSISPEKKIWLIEWIEALVGSFIFAFGVNFIITPLNLYNGGFMGIAQLIRTFIISIFHLNVPAGFDFSGIIFFIINVPLFYMGLRIMGKKFTIRTFIAVAVQSVFLSILPIPKTPMVEDYLTACIVGGIIVGAGAGLILRGRSSGGGQDIIGVCCAKKYPGFSVGKVAILINILVYGICLVFFDIEVVIYSFIYTAVVAVALDKIHIQNINTSVMIFTKKQGISKAIMEQLGRGVTNWDGVGAYTNIETYVLFTMISKYEVRQLKSIVHDIDPDAFVVFNEGASVDGNFEKRL